MLVKQNRRSLLVDDKGLEGATPAKKQSGFTFFSGIHHVQIHAEVLAYKEA